MSERVQRRRGEATRRAILTAAEQEFAAKGFEGASMRSIARACGMELALVQYHFGEKLALWGEIVQRVMGELHQQWARTYAQIKEWAPAQVLANFIETLIRHAATHPNFVAILSHARLEGSAYSRVFETYVRKDIEEIIALIKRAQREGTFVDGRPELLFYLMLGAALRVFMMAADAKKLGLDVEAGGTVADQVRACTSLFIRPAASSKAAGLQTTGRSLTRSRASKQHLQPLQEPAESNDSADPGSPSTFYLLTNTDAAVRKQLEGELRDLGITLGQMMVLIRIANEHRLSSARLARALDVSAQTVTLFVKSLEAQGLIVRGHGKVNRKVLEIKLTARGQKVLQKLHEVVAASQTRLLEGLTSLERDTLRDLLTRILARHRPQALTEWSPLLRKDERG
jgi:AcrR family transcriptional regulator/DNA-binding MarR family transcriptional regulator